MVITCPKCSARYKLPQDKIQGRGAKITCPRCNNVFVVFNETRQGDGPAGTANGTAADGARSPESPRRGAAPGLGPRPAPPSPPPAAALATDAPPPRPVVPPSPPPPPSEAGGERTVEFQARADRLNFREVGIQTWKVRVAIGLTYDFSDISTLRRYLDDKKVTPADQISWDGKTWVRIGDIGDLERYFIKVWSEARDRSTAAGQGGAAKGTRPAGRAPVADDALAAAVAAAEEEVEGAARSQVSMPTMRTVTGPGVRASGNGAGRSGNAAPAGRSEGDAGSAPNPYRVDLKSPPKKKGAGRPAKAAPPRLGAGAILGILALALGALWLWRATRGEAPQVPVPSAAPTGTGAKAGEAATSASMERFSQRVRERLEKERRDASARDPSDIAAEQAAEEVVDKGRLVPVRPPGPAAATRPAAAPAAQGIVQPRGAPPPPREIPIAPPAPAQPGPRSDVEVSTTEITAADHAELGRMAYARGDWAAAAEQYGLAAGLEPRNGQHRYQQGRSYQAASRLAEAERAFREAVGLNPALSSAWRILGEIAERQGKRGEAAEHYRRYLESTPSAPDAESVRARLREVQP